MFEEMDCAEIEESKPTTLVSAPENSTIPSSGNCIWSFPHSSSGINSLHFANSFASCQNVMELNLPAAEHTVNSFALQLGCSRSSGSLMANSTLCAAHSETHVPLLHSALTKGLSPPGSPVPPWSPSVMFSSENDVAHMSTPFQSSDKALPSRFEFMHSFVGTLLPQLQRIHSQSSHASPQEKFSAVRVAADMSLAISAGSNNIWSQVLLQELSNSYSNKLRVRKGKRRYSNSCRGKVYARILRGNNGSYAMRERNCAIANSFKGVNAQAFNRLSYQASLGASAKCSHPSSSGSVSKGCSHGVRYRKSLYVGRMQRDIFKRNSGFVSYVKVLRNSRAMAKSRSVKAVAGSGSKGSIVQIVPAISKEQIASLGALVPGGHNMDVPLLFQEAADYILSLQMQVEALQALSHSVIL